MAKIVKIIICIVGGYLIGSLNPAALFAGIKKTDLRKKGTGNLGATNTLLVLGKPFGLAVFIFDISKAALCVITAEQKVPEIQFAGLICGALAVLGHIFPFYLRFRGGKGLAPFAGTILAFDPLMFLVLLVICVSFMLIFDYTVTLSWSGACLFPFFTAVSTGSSKAFFIALFASMLILYKHYPNFKKALQGKDPRIRPYIKRLFFRQ